MAVIWYFRVFLVYIDPITSIYIKKYESRSVWGPYECLEHDPFSPENSTS